jgi:nucleoside-diphosphate kinase
VDRLLRQERERTLNSPQVQRTFSFLKPESIRQRTVGEIISRLERKGLALRQLKLHVITKKEAEELYSVHKSKPFFHELVEHVTSGPVVLMVLEGPNAVDTLRKLVGATDPLLAEPGTIRGDYSVSVTANIIHASDSSENARREASIFFREPV